MGPQGGVLIDPGHDFGKTTWHSLEVTRRLGELVATGWPVLVSTSNKDGLDPALAHDLLVAGRAAWQVLAGAAGTGPTPSARIRYADDPFGVAYVVASWSVPSRTPVALPPS